MEIGNRSPLDEGTAAAEAMAMMLSLRSRDAVREGRNQLFVDRNIFPQTLDVLLTRSEPFGIELIVDDYDEYEFTGRGSGAIVTVRPPTARRALTTGLHGCGARQGRARNGRRRPAVAGAPESPGRVGRRHRRGFGAAPRHADGLRRSRRGLHDHARGVKRNAPGRIIGVSVDRLGNRRCVWPCRCANSAQRERATSNICTRLGRWPR